MINTVVGPNVNSVSSYRNGNLFEKYSNSEIQERIKEDKIVINKDFIADLKYNKDKAALGTIMEGHVNGHPARFKVVSNDNDESWFEGFIKNKYCMIHSQDGNYTGKYGNSDFELTVDYNKPSAFSKYYSQVIKGRVFRPDYFTVKGRMGNQKVDITLPNTKIPQDSDLRDILTLVLEDNGLKAQTINGEVKSLKFSSSAVKTLKQKAEKREKVINNDLKPIFMQGISSATGLIVGSVVSAILLKFGLKR